VVLLGDYSAGVEVFTELLLWSRRIRLTCGCCVPDQLVVMKPKALAGHAIILVSQYKSCPPGVLQFNLKPVPQLL